MTKCCKGKTNRNTRRNSLPNTHRMRSDTNISIPSTKDREKERVKNMPNTVKSTQRKREVPKHTHEQIE